METIETVRYKNVLLQLGVYDRFKRNVINNRKQNMLHNYTEDVVATFLARKGPDSGFASFVAHSFVWAETPEGEKFWRHISKSDYFE